MRAKLFAKEAKLIGLKPFFHGHNGACFAAKLRLFRKLLRPVIKQHIRALLEFTLHGGKLVALLYNGVNGLVCRCTEAAGYRIHTRAVLLHGQNSPHAAYKAYPYAAFIIHVGQYLQYADLTGALAMRAAACAGIHAARVYNGYFTL